ncbi:MAG TPA: hypothetical protein VLE96_03875, partial [Chlamydiales bacterium]|nr:hypothetical protein [Chlamydiales bacterium]
IARTTMQVYQESFQQNLVLQAHGRKIFTDDANKLVSFLMDARMAEMKLLEEGLSTCYKQENFALEMFLKQRAMSMQKEVQTFNQILRLQELDHQSKMQRLDHKQEMELLQQSHDDKMAFIEKEQSEMRAAHAAKMNGLESEARQQIANLLTQTQEVGGK